MQTIKADLPESLQKINLHVFSDWHIGDRACKYEEILAEIEEVKTDANAYVICNGDLMNNATKTSVSDSYAEEIPPNEQINKLVQLLEPIKDKILLITQGNHENRTYKTDGIDLTSMVALRLGLEKKYCKTGGLLFLRFGRTHRGRKQVYSIYATHGSGGGRKEGAKAIRLADMASIVDADIYIHSHTHLPMIMKQSFFRVSASNSSVAICDKLFVNTSARLGYGGYGQAYEFKPSSSANPVIYLAGNKRHMAARL